MGAASVVSLTQEKRGGNDPHICTVQVNEIKTESKMKRLSYKRGNDLLLHSFCF